METVRLKWYLYQLLCFPGRRRGDDLDCGADVNYWLAGKLSGVLFRRTTAGARAFLQFVTPIFHFSRGLPLDARRFFVSGCIVKI
ncbi:MAG: hypothetical protein ACK5PS_03225 [Desulfopila sp.]